MWSVVVTYQGRRGAVDVAYLVPPGTDRSSLRSKLLARRRVITVRFAKVGTRLPICASPSKETVQKELTSTTEHPNLDLTSTSAASERSPATQTT